VARRFDGPSVVHREWVQMKKAFLIFLFTTSPAFADDQNVYNFFGNCRTLIAQSRTNKRPLLSSVTWLICSTQWIWVHSLDRKRTRNFASRLSRCKKQMGVPATGTLTLDEFRRLAEAARDIDDRPIGTTMKKAWLKTEIPCRQRGPGAPTMSPTHLAHPSTLAGFAASKLPARAS